MSSGSLSRLPKGRHGFYLPDIRTFNSYADEILSSMNPDTISRGSVEDMISDGLNGKCDRCSGDLIRELATINIFYFLGGIIRCKSAETKKEHPLDYWIEVWPNTLWTSDGEKREYPLSLKYEDFARKVFLLSEPHVRECYFGLDYYRMLEANRVTVFREDAGIESDFKPFPEPAFVHSHIPSQQNL